MNNQNISSTIRMYLVTKPIRVVTYCKELPPRSLHDTMDTKLGKVLIYHQRLSPLKPHDPMWVHATIWKICICRFPSLMATNFDRGRRFSAQTIKLSSTSSWFFDNHFLHSLTWLIVSLWRIWRLLNFLV